ncbi:hypothetical protein L208DRAFT_1462170 [Tricholoma matsutake]|nr:hypothetical protein L208DRAFT_1462170 [Tricholoma matsutake 945]
MPDRKRNGQEKSKIISVETRQKTLLDMFPRKTVSVATPPVDEAQEHEPSNHETEVRTAIASDIHIEDSAGTTTTRIKPRNSQPKPLYPLFTKQPKTTQIQKATVEDEIIEVPDDEPGPSSLPLSGSPFCADFPEPCCSPRPGGSQEDPIVLDSSPMRPSLPSPLPLRPQFVPSRRQLIGPPLPVSSQAKSLGDRDTDHVPYPDRNSQHVRGPQQVYSAPDIPYSRRQLRHTPTTTISHFLPMLDLNLDMNDAAASTDIMHFLPYSAAGKKEYVEQIPNEHSSLHPAILRLVDPDAVLPPASSSVHKAWTDKWRPTRAEEVLGNESNAIYLRNWLCALELHFDTNSMVTSKQDHRTHGTAKAGKDARKNKRPRVVRAVEKRRGRKKRRIDSDDDDWIVHSDEFEDEIFKADNTDDEIEQETVSRLDSHSDPALSTSQQFPHHLTNTILLAGPSGVGKTAAAYACADELGWEVFEVYPGIGKRNGASIENMIGDVGKNHLVRKTQHRGGETSHPSKGHDAFDVLLVKGKDSADERPQDSHSPAVDFGFISRTDNQSGQGTEEVSTVRQSLILLEEVDILFKEDSNFWPTVTSFIKDCKRPVICTCNDISLVPTLDLPLQTILTFQACPAPVATSYLQGLCSAEGYLVERDSLLELYDSTCECTDIPISSSALLEDFPVPDLRRTINCLQLRCSTTGGTIPPSGRTVKWQTESEYSIEDLSDWKWSIKGPSSPSVSSADAEFPSPCVSVISHVDLVSFVDSQLLQSELDRSEEFNDFEPSANDERAVLLHGVPAAGSGFEFRRRDIASTVMRLSRGALDKQGLTLEVKDNLQSRGLFHARVEHQVQMAKGLKKMIPPSVWVTGKYAIHMDYGPWIRQLVAEEDKQEELHMKRERTGRMTRNSGGSYERTIVVTATERVALAGTRLEGGRWKQ